MRSTLDSIPGADLPSIPFTTSDAALPQVPGAASPDNIERGNRFGFLEGLNALERFDTARLRVAPVDDTGQVILEEYERLFNPRARLAAFAHVSNALGTITPIAEMIEIAHRHGARALVDGAQSVAHTRVDMQAYDCDFFVFSGHKIFAPTGIGVVYGKGEVLDHTPPWQGGGNMIADVTFEKTAYQPPPLRFEAGTGNIADASAWAPPSTTSTASAWPTSPATRTTCSRTQPSLCAASPACA